MFHESFIEEEISSMFQGSFMIKGVSRVFQGSFKKTFKVFKESFMCMALIAASRAEGGLVLGLGFTLLYSGSSEILTLTRPFVDISSNFGELYKKLEKRF